MYTMKTTIVYMLDSYFQTSMNVQRTKMIVIVMHCVRTILVRSLVNVIKVTWEMVNRVKVCFGNFYFTYIGALGAKYCLANVLHHPSFKECA